MTYFFKDLENDEDRWQFIEDYFLGVAEEKYKAKTVGKIGIKSIDDSVKGIPTPPPPKSNEESIKIYTLYNDEDNESIKYYISVNQTR